jgi:hypothetical protein
MTQTFTPTPLAQTAETFEGMVEEHSSAAMLRGIAEVESSTTRLAVPDGVVDRLDAARASLIAHDASQRQLIADLLEAVLASEREYDEETTPGDPLCAECNLGTGPHRRICAHHLRVAVIAKAGGAV